MTDGVVDAAAGGAVSGGAVSASVVVCCYTEDRWPDITAALASVSAQTVQPLEVVVVVDHNDALLARAELAFPLAVVVPNKESRGLSGARNTGVAQASGEVVAFLDDDAAAAPDWLEVMLGAYRDPAVVGVGTTVTASWPHTRPNWFPPEFDWVVGCSYVGLPETTAPVRNPIGAAMSFRREVFDRVEGFSSDLGRVGTLPLGCEETEFCIRVRQSSPDAVILFEPATEVRHRVSSGRTSPRYFLRRCYAEGLSKAAVRGRVGRQQALSAERDYVRRVLPRATLRGPRPAGAVVAGLAVTTLGYLVGVTRASRHSGGGPDGNGSGV